VNHCQEVVSVELQFLSTLLAQHQRRTLRKSQSGGSVMADAGSAYRSITQLLLCC
jgi:hypothetical protein